VGTGNAFHAVTKYVERGSRELTILYLLGNMPIRYLIVGPLFACVLLLTLLRPKFGIIAFLGLLFIPPQFFFWGFIEWRMPFVVAMVLLISSVLNPPRRYFPVFSGTQRIWWTLLLASLINSVLWSADFDRSYAILVDTWLKTFTFAFLLILWTEEEKDVRRVLWTVVICFSLLAMRGLYQYSKGYEEIGGIGFTTMADRNDFAMHLAMVVPIAFFLVRTSDNRWVKFGLACSVVILFACIVATYSRMGFLLIGLSFSYLWFVSKRKILYLIVAGTIALVAVAVMPGKYFDRMATIFNDKEQDASITGRLDGWRYGWKMVEDHPITGVGLDTFETPKVYYHYADSGDSHPHVAHNAYIQIAAEAGIGAFIGWFMWILVSVKQLGSVVRGSVNEKLRACALALKLSISFYLVGAIFLSAEDRELLFVVLGLCIVVNSLYKREAEENVPQKYRLQGLAPSSAREPAV